MAVLVLSLGFATLSSAQDAAKSPALTPVDRKTESWKKRFALMVENLKKGDAELLLVGDSITHGWDNPGAKEAKVKYLDEWKWVNFGISGDRTQHVLWRIANAPMNAIKPKACMVMIGTNNIGQQQDVESPKDAADGVKAIVVELQKHYPDMKILVLHVFPRGATKDDPKRMKVDEINSYLPELLKGMKNVELLNINDKFLDADGNLSKDIMPDLLHPNAKGYEIWGATVNPVLKKMIRP